MKKKHSLLDERALRGALRTMGIKESHAIELQHCLIRALLAHADTLDVRRSSAIWEQAMKWESSPAKLLRDPLLRSSFDALTSTVVLSKESKDAATRKMVVELKSGAQVECVIMQHSTFAALPAPRCFRHCGAADPHPLLPTSLPDAIRRSHDAMRFEPGWVQNGVQVLRHGHDGGARPSEQWRDS